METIERYDHMNTIEYFRTGSMFFGGQPLEGLFFRTVRILNDEGRGGGGGEEETGRRGRGEEDRYRLYIL